MDIELSGNKELRRLPPDPGVPWPVGPVPPAGADTLCRPPPDPGVLCAFDPSPLAGNSEFRRLAGATKSLANGRAALAACGQKYCIVPKGTLRTFSTYILSTVGVGYLVSPLQKSHESTSGKAYTMSFHASSQATLLTLMGCPPMAPRRLPTFPRSCSYFFIRSQRPEATLWYSTTDPPSSRVHFGLPSWLYIRRHSAALPWVWTTSREHVAMCIANFL